jgi:hypothetical protein
MPFLNCSLPCRRAPPFDARSRLLATVLPVLAEPTPPADIRFTGESGGADLFRWSAAAAGT